MRRFCCCFLLSFFLVCTCLSEIEKTPIDADGYGLLPKPILRALLIGCDTFATEDSLAPSASENVEAIRDILNGDRRGYASIRVSINEAMDKQAFEHSVDEAFSGAKDNDISFFYISTHGQPSHDQADEYTLLLSDGKTDYRLTSEDLLRTLERVPGEKVVWVDACNSGMLLKRGMLTQENMGGRFKPRFQVMTSCGGSELSYFWHSSDVSGGSYLVTALKGALTKKGRYAADADRNLSVTMRELQQYLLSHYGASTPQFYPSNGEFSILEYQKQPNDSDRALVTDLVLDETTLSGSQREVAFSYTLHARARIAYQMVYEKEGEWQFEAPQIAEENEGRHGIVTPGRICRTLCLQDFGEDLYGYVLFMIVAVDEDSMTPLATTLISIEQDAEVEPQVSVVRQFFPDRGEEATLFVGHQKPCTITITVRDEQGDIVAQPVYEQMSRPQHLDTPGSLFYWPGTDDEGNTLPKGAYSLQVTLRTGSKTVDAFSRAFSIE